jgi:Ca2+-binding RTX toxin-like protein
LYKRRLTLNFTIIATLAVIFGTAMTTTNSVWAATINCPNRVPTPGNGGNCFGTFESDRMLGTADVDIMTGLGGDDTMFGYAKNDAMVGSDGDDTMSGGSGNDFLDGQRGNDNINGDSGDDEIRGGLGADILKGSSGNDIILHGDKIAGIPIELLSDGSTDHIDCDSGTNDVAFINTSVDHDTAVNCETVNAG